MKKLTKRFAPPLALVVAGLATLLFSGSATGQTYGVTNPACGSTLTTSAIFTQNMDCSGSSTAYTVGAAGITINLNGHQILGDGVSGHTCIYDDAYNNVTITGPGILKSCGYGVNFYSVSGATVKGFTVNNSYEAVYDEYGASSFNSITANDPSYEGYDGYYSASQVGGWTMNFTGSSSAYGTYCEYCNGLKVSSNKITAESTTSVYGFYEDYSNLDTYSGNTVTGGDYGFYFDCDEYGTVTATGNSALGGSDYGFYVYYCENEEDSYLHGNNMPVTTISGNTAKNNDSYGFYDEYSLNSVWSGNTATNNGDTGFYFDDDTVMYTITGNTATGNQGDGFYLNYPPYYYAPLSVTKNVATHNADYGFDTDGYGVAGSGNSASSNGSGGSYTLGGVTGQP